MPIRELDDTTIRQIAAGEVIDRPASVVKELVENSLDADATTIDVSVQTGGIDRIQVADDGHGMTQADAKLAVQQHTTSKITGATDLTTINTLGFRGEALHAITTVAKTTLTTKPPGADRGTRLIIDHGSLTETEPVGRPVGTTVTVEELFAEMPARQEFLKSERTEFEHVNQIVSKYALANPDVAVSLRHDGRDLFATSGHGDLHAAIRAVYGREAASAMVPIDTDRIQGVVSHPDTNRSTRAYLTTIVNGRVVQSPLLREAIIEAYGNQLPSDRYPFAVIAVTLPTDAVDVNIHPRKLQVRFTEPDAVKQQVQTTVTDALRDNEILEAATRSPPTETSEPQASLASNTRASTPNPPDDSPPRSPRDDPQHPGRAATTQPTDRTQADPEAPGHHTQGASGHQETLGGQPATPTQDYDSFSSLRILGQLHETYIVAEAADGLVLIDQHAADERIHYEQLQAQTNTEPRTQTLTQPVEVPITLSETTHLDTTLDALTQIGFQINLEADTTLLIQGVPTAIAEALTPARLTDVVTSCLNTTREPTRPIKQLTDDLIADLACHPAITGNTSLTEGSLLALLNDLDACSNPYACPHGRPVLIQINNDELQERFERDYPGHGGRRGE